MEHQQNDHNYHDNVADDRNKKLMLRVYSTNRSENASFNMVFSALEKVHLYYLCGGEHCLCFLRGNNIIYRFRQALKRSSHFFFPHFFFVSSTKLKPLLWIKCVIILMYFHLQLLRVRVED